MIARNDISIPLSFREGLTGIQWLASEAWSTASVLSTPKKHHHILQGSMGFAIRRAHIPGLQEFLLHLHPSSPEPLSHPFLIPFWEEVFQCRLGVQAEGQEQNIDSKPPCSGTEDLGSVTNIYSDVSQLRISYNVYKAVYAIVHALQAMRSCVKGNGPFPQQACPDEDNIQPWQVPSHMFTHLLKINKSYSGAKIYIVKLTGMHCIPLVTSLHTRCGIRELLWR